MFQLIQKFIFQYLCTYIFQGEDIFLNDFKAAYEVMMEVKSKDRLEEPK